MKIIVDNVFFDYNIGCKLLKRKYTNCPLGLDLEDIWENIVPLSIEDAFKIDNVENRRIAFKHIPQKEFLGTLNPDIISTVIIPKTITWVNPTKIFDFDDEYTLCKVKSQDLFKETISNRRMSDFYYVKFKDTSTDREYMIWVDMNSILALKQESVPESTIEDIDAIDAIAWTIQSNIPLNFIKSITRQGDCIVFQTVKDYTPLETERHLTKNEYLNLILTES